MTATGSTIERDDISGALFFIINQKVSDVNTATCDFHPLQFSMQEQSVGSCSNIQYQRTRVSTVSAILLPFLLLY